MYNFNLTKWFDIKKVIKSLPKYNKFLIVAPNQCGKTYSAVRLMIDNLLKKGETGAWIRNTELELGTIAKPFADALEDAGQYENYIINKHGIFTVRKGKGKDSLIPDEMKIAFIYLSSLAKITPQSISPSLIVLDEFIDGSHQRRFHMDHYGTRLKNAIHRLIGAKMNPNIKIVGLANPHFLENDLLVSLGISYNWDRLSKGEIDVQTNEETKTWACCIPKAFRIKQKSAINDFIGTIDYQNMGIDSSYKFAPEKFKTVFPNEKFTPVFILHSNKGYLAFGKGETCNYYVKECERQDYELPIYVLESNLLDVGEVYLKTTNDVISTFEIFIKALVEGKIHYGSAFAKEECKEVKYILDDIIEANNEDWDE